MTIWKAVFFGSPSFNGLNSFQEILPSVSLGGHAAGPEGNVKKPLVINFRRLMQLHSSPFLYPAT